MKKIRGFSLIEISVIMAVLSVSIAMTINFNKSDEVTNAYKYRKTEKNIKLIRNNIYSFKNKFNRLPCPAKINSGIENCNIKDGFIPFLTLSLKKEIALDEWRLPIKYNLDESNNFKIISENKIKQIIVQGR